MNNKLRGNDFWGEGIPKYENEDIMSRKEILDFSIEIVLQFGTQKDGYTVISVDNRINANPNLILEKDGKTYYVLIRGDDVHSQPSISESEKNLLIENSKKDNAIPLFASVGIGSTDPDRFDAKLLLRNDGFYANFEGYEEIEVANTKSKNETKKENTTSIKKEIGSLYVHYIDDNHGLYNSFRNFCCNKMVYLSFVYGRNGVHISSTPDEYKISEDSSNKIRDIIKKEFKNLESISKAETEKLDSYISIVYVDDTTEYFAFNDKVAKAFELREKIKEGFDVKSEPYLVFNDKKYNRNVRAIMSIGDSIKNKKLDEIINCLSSNFEIKFKCKRFKENITNIRELKLWYGKFAGLFGFKLTSHYIFITKLGVLESGESKVNIGVEISGKNYKIKCVCSFNFNESNRIDFVSITECDDLYRMGKVLTDEDIMEIINGNYNDMNDKAYDDNLETNEDLNSIYRIQN